MYFYLAYVTVVLSLLLVRRPRTAALLAVGYALAVALAFVASRYSLVSILDFFKRHIPGYIDLAVGTSNESYYRWFFYFSPYARLFEFFMGCLTAHALILLRHRSVTSMEQRFANAIFRAALAALAALFGALFINVINIGVLSGILTAPST